MLVNKDYVIILFAPNVINIGLDVLALFENVIGVKFFRHGVVSGYCT